MTTRTLLLLGGLLLPDGLLAQVIDPAKFTAKEKQYQAQAANLDRHGAIETLLADLKQAEGGRRRAAFAEYEVLQVIKLARDFANPRRIRDAFTKLADSPFAKAHPTYRSTLLLHLMRLHHASGDFPRRDALRGELSFIRDWWIIGPFDNERGSGHGRRFAPEQEFEPDKGYPGKKREVRWRALPVDPPTGWIDLAAMIRPTRQVLCYAATSLHTEAATTVVLQLGSSQTFQVFLNGKRVSSRDVRRRFQFDQDAVVLHLQKGANLLMLKICTQAGGLGFAARLTGLSGEGITGITTAAGKAELLAARTIVPRAAAEAKVFRGARSVFGERGADAFRLSRVLAFYHADDRDDRRMQDRARSAVKDLPGAAAPRFALAATRISAARIAAERDENLRRHDYESILTDHPNHLRTTLALARMDLASITAAVMAERRLRRMLSTQPDNPHLHALHAEVLEALDLDSLAVIARHKAAAQDEHHNYLTAARRHVGRAYLRQGRLVKAAEYLSDLVAHRPTVSDLITLAIVHMRAGRRDSAVKLFEHGIRSFPYDASVPTRYSRLLEAEGDLAGAMAQNRSWLAICPEDDKALVNLAQLYGLNGQIDRQRELLRTAVTLNPNRKRERRHLEFLEAEEKPFYHGYEIDSATVIARDRGAPEDAGAANDPFYYLLNHRVIHAYRNGTTSDYRHLIVRILNEEGGKRFARYVVSHYWGEQRARLLSVRVVKKDGQEMRPRLRGTATTLPPLSAGDLVDIRYRVDDTAPGFFGDYFGFQHQFPLGTPMNESSLVVVLDKGRDYSLQAINGAPQPTRTKDSKGREVWRFEMRDLARFKQETRQPAHRETKPLVRVTTYKSWDQFASWWFHLIKKQSEVSPAMRKKVLELTTGLTSTREKIDAIYRFVTTEVRYEAWEFGVHGYKPYSAPVIFERRHGDCKDKSLLLNSMLSVIGVQAWPVLIHANETRSRDDLTLPMVDHFNHCISFVGSTDGNPGMFLDGTATYHPTDTLPNMDYGAEVLVVRGDRGQVRAVPWPTAASNHSRVDVQITLDPSGDAEVIYDRTPLRNQAVWVRDYLGNEPAKRRERLEEILKAGFGAIELRDHKISDLSDLHQPVSVHVTFKASRFAHRQGRGLVLESSIGANPVAQLAIPEQRTAPLLLGVPRSEQQTITYRLPPGYRPLNLPPPTDLTGPFGNFHLGWHQKGDRLTVTRRLAIQAHRVPADGYRAFREFVTRVDESSQQVVVIEKEGQ